jgi:hypothetical protein
MLRIAALLLVLVTPASALAADDVGLRVVSNRADLISGGDALVAATVPGGARASDLRFDVDGRDVTGAFAGGLTGLVTGLKDGDNVLTARLPDGRGARITIVNHPIGGPVFAGPQVTPWFCRTQDEGLGKPLDAQCNAPTKIEYVYRSTDPSKGGWQDYDPAHPPSDVATTKTDQGAEVPFVVRVERGTLDRSIYAIAALNDARAWNHKLDVPFGGSCGPEHRQMPAPDVLDDSGTSGQLQGTGHAEYALARGFMVASTGLNILGQDCNTVVSAEALMMLKEHIAEGYGSIRYTMGEGCSGGSIQQQQIAANYPGLLDGIMPQCSFPDTSTTGNDVVDCSLMEHYFTEDSPQLWASPAQQGQAAGHQSSSACQSWHTVYGFDQTENPGGPTSAAPTDAPAGPAEAIVSCGVPADQTYDAKARPHGVRCTLQDYNVAIWGRRAQDGFAKGFYDNVGVQYGLTALQSGQITAEQFVDLNEKVGGYTIDFVRQPQRTAADPGATAIAYRSGQVSNGRELANVPIIDLRGTSNQEIHNDYRSYATRERLKKANGTAANQVIFTAGSALAVPQEVSDKAFDLMDKWLAAIEADHGDEPLAVKVRQDKPAAAVDTCWVGTQAVTDQQSCRLAFPVYGSTRMAAGGPLADDVMKCRLKPLDRTDYDVTFTDDEWARLAKAFPTGVCDWSKQSVGEQAPIVWPTFAAGPGGTPLGPPPVAHAFQAVGLSASRSCASRRVVRVRLHGRRVRALRAFVNGRRVRVVRGRVDLTGLPRGTVRVKVVAVTRAGRRLVGVRRYRLCVSARRAPRHGRR